MNEQHKSSYSNSTCNVFEKVSYNQSYEKNIHMLFIYI